MFGITAFTCGAIDVITSESRDVKFTKSVRYAIRSSREFLMSTGSISCMNAGQLLADEVLDCGGTEDDSVVGVVVRSEALSREGRSAAAPYWAKGHVLSPEYASKSKVDMTDNRKQNERR